MKDNRRVSTETPMILPAEALVGVHGGLEPPDGPKLGPRAYLTWYLSNLSQHHEIYDRDPMGAPYQAYLKR
jgi:hypothetical protein